MGRPQSMLREAWGVGLQGETHVGRLDMRAPSHSHCSGIVYSYCVSLNACPQDWECHSRHQESLLEPLSFHLTNKKAESQGNE